MNTPRRPRPVPARTSHPARLVLSACALLLPAAPAAQADRAAPDFTDTFEDRAELGEAWAAHGAMAESWTVQDGVLIGDQTTPDHGAVINKPLVFRDLDLSFDFMFDGATRFNLVIDDENEKSVHAGHICRISISPKRLTLGDDKTGKMNKKIRELQKQGDKAPARERRKLKKHLASREVSAPLKLEQGRWYRLRARIIGDRFEAFLDGEPVAALRSPGFAHRTKTDFGFTITGSVMRYDNIEAHITQP